MLAVLSGSPADQSTHHDGIPLHFRQRLPQGGAHQPLQVDGVVDEHHRNQQRLQVAVGKSGQGTMRGEKGCGGGINKSYSLATGQAAQGVC